MTTAFQANAFQNDAFQTGEVVVEVEEVINPTGIGAVADFRKSDKAEAERRAKEQADAEDRKRAVYEAFYGKPPEPIEIEDLSEVLADDSNPFIEEFVREHLAGIQNRERMALKEQQDKQALEMLLMVA